MQFIMLQVVDKNGKDVEQKAFNKDDIKQMQNSDIKDEERPNLEIFRLILTHDSNVLVSHSFLADRKLEGFCMHLNRRASVT